MRRLCGYPCLLWMQNNLAMPKQLQKLVSALSDRIDILKSTLRGKFDRMKELEELLRMVQFYTDGRPVADKLAAIKWKGRREQFMSENALRLYHMAECKLPKNSSKVERNIIQDLEKIDSLHMNSSMVISPGTSFFI